MSNPLRDYNIRRKYWQLKDRRLQHHEKLVERALIRFLREQKERVMQSMPQTRKGLVDEVFNREREAQLAKRLLFPVLKDIMEQEAREVGSRYNAPITFSSEMESWLDERANIFTEQITKTTYDQLSRELLEATEQGEDYDQMGKRITDKFNEISEGRAKTIARTETHGCQQKANIEGYKQSGVESKIWVAVMDGETRDTHAMVDGDEMPFDRPFSNGLMFPGDPAGLPEETINCRCQI